MLINILKEIAKSSTHSYDSLAKSLNLDPEMVKQMFHNLLKLGYIISDDPACGEDRCEGCSVRCNNTKDMNKVIITRWRLTEKGEKALEDKR